MVVTESEMATSQEEMESALPADQHPKNHPFSSLGRQSSIYSLTLDEFQHSLCDTSKSFGSMNMDEFLTSIWTAEENQVLTGTGTAANMNNANNHIVVGNNANQVLNDPYNNKGITTHPSLPRQGSLTLPPPLCRKTVDEVWSQIKKEQSSGNDGVHNSKSATHQPTFGEMTLEDFLIKAGVVREQCSTEPSQQQHNGLYQSNNNRATVTGFVRIPISGMAHEGGSTGGVLHHGVGPVVESSGRNGGYEPPPASTASAGSGGGYGQGQGMGAVASPMSPVSPDGMVTNFENFGMDIGGLRGRKRIIDGPVEKVAERRQRRVIKNRESAARSRARKQAYTVELEAELNQLKEENKQLKLALAELERKRKQQFFEELRMKAQTKAYNPKEKPRLMRRSSSCPS